MSNASPETRCPHCGTDTGIERGGDPRLPGKLHAHEFEILVRNEWRRTLGHEAYDRVHEARIVRTLTSIFLEGRRSNVARELADELNQVVADISACGRGRAAVRHELALLLRSLRHVLDRSGATEESATTFVATAQVALEEALGYPDGLNLQENPS